MLHIYSVNSLVFPVDEWQTSRKLLYSTNFEVTAKGFNRLNEDIGMFMKH